MKKGLRRSLVAHLKAGDGPNRALMKKGLRLASCIWVGGLVWSEPSPDEEGIKTLPDGEFQPGSSPNRALMKKGLRPDMHGVALA